MEFKSIKKNYILNLIKTISGLIFPLITFAYASRAIRAEGIGRVDYTRSIVSYFTLFASLGISTYGIREGAKVRNDRIKLSKLVKELLIINAITTVCAYVLFYIALYNVSKFEEYRILLVINGLAIGFTALGLDWLYGALEDFEYITVRYILFQIISLILLFVFVKDKNDYYIYAGIITFSGVGSNLLNFIHAKKYVSLHGLKDICIKKHIKPILIFFSNTLAGNVYITLDTSMLGFMSTDYSVGLYSASIKMNRICVGIITSLSTVLLPRLSYYLNFGDDEKYHGLLMRSFDFIIMLSLPLMCGLYLLSKEFIGIFSGEEFVTATSCSQILSIIILLIPISTFFSTQVLIPFGEEKKQLFGTIIGACSNILTNALMVPIYNQDGAAIGTVVAETLVALLAIIFSRRYINLRLLAKNIWHYMLATIIMVMVLLLIAKYFSGIIKCMICFCVGVLIYGLVLWLMKDECFEYVKQNFKKQLKKD